MNRYYTTINIKKYELTKTLDVGSIVSLFSLIPIMIINYLNYINQIKPNVNFSYDPFKLIY